jgi:hypothetical protein
MNAVSRSIHVATVTGVTRVTHHTCDPTWMYPDSSTSIPGTGGVCADTYTKRGTPAALAAAMAAAFAAPLTFCISDWLPKPPTQLMAARAPGSSRS